MKKLVTVLLALMLYIGLTGTAVANSAVAYSSTITPTANGTVTADMYSATAGASVPLTATANDGYHLAEISVTDTSDNICPVTEVVDSVTGKIGYVFEMPESNVTVYVTFRELVPDVPTEYELKLQLQVVDSQENVISEWVYGHIDEGSLLDNSTTDPTQGSWTIGVHYVAFEDGLIPEGYLIPDAFNFTVNADGTVSSNTVDVELKDNIWVLTIVLEKEDEQVPVSTYTVTWTNNDGTVLETDEDVPYGETPSYDGDTPTKAADSQYRYVFAGWEPEVAVVSADVTYTAVYTSSVNHYTVTWVDENENVVATEVVEYGNNAQNAPDVPVKVGYSGEWDHDGAYITEDTTIHPRYTINQYTISFDSDGGSAIESITADYGTIISKLDDPTKEGYVFVGWDTEIPETMPAEDMTITATWELMPIVVETYIMNTEGTYPETPNKTQALNGNSLIPTPLISQGFDLDEERSILTGEIINEKRVYRFYIERNQYTLTTIVDGIETQKAYYFGAQVTAPDDPTKTGYTFAGWDTSIPSTMPAKDITATATWTINEYSILYDGNGGYVLGSNYLPNLITSKGVRLPFGYPQHLPEAPFVRPGYTLIGWNTLPDGSGESWNENLTVPAHDVTYYAQWAPNISEIEPLYSAYSVTHYQQQLDGTSYTEVTADTQFPLYAEIGDTVSAVPKSYTGYTCNAGKSTPSANVIRATADANGNPVYTKLELYYDLNSYTITFDTAGGNQIEPITQKYGSAVTAPANPTREGYTFYGWDQAIPATMPAENLTITARWGILPVITAPLADQTITVYEGEQATMPTIVAENAVSYQWQINYNDGTGWHDKDGENSPTYTTSPTKLENNGYRYRCVVTSADGETVNSPIFTLEVLKMVVLPETGDNAQPLLWVVLAALSLIGMTVMMKKRKEA